MRDLSAVKRIACIALIAVLAALLSACGSTKTVTVTTTQKPVLLNTQRVASAISSSILSQRGLAANTTCPTTIYQQQGIVFTCTAIVKKKTYPVTVTEVDGSGHVTFVVGAAR